MYIPTGNQRADIIGDFITGESCRIYEKFCPLRSEEVSFVIFLKGSIFSHKAQPYRGILMFVERAIRQVIPWSVL